MWREEPADDPWGHLARQSRAHRMRPQAMPAEPVAGPTAALRGRAGGPGFVVPPGAVAGLYDPAQRSGWQLAQGVWEESGISWEPPATEPRPGPGWSEYARGGAPGGQSWPADDYGQDDLPPHAFAPPPGARQPGARQPGTRRDDTRPDGDWEGGPWQDDIHQPSARQAARWETGLWQDDIRQPDARQAAGWEPSGWETGVWQADGPAFDLGESDELFRAWQGSVRQAAGPPRATAARRRQAWNVVRVGVPAAVLVTVGAGAVMMLTGKTNEMLATRGDQGSPSPGAGGSAAAFAGYPGQHGTVTVNSIATAGGTRLAVGSADGHPAIWRRAADGSWTLISESAIYQRPGTASLISVAHGPRGWIAVGGADPGGAQQPVVLTSADGATWQPAASAAFTAPGTYVMGVTAGPGGYVVVGRQVSDGRTFAALWWSADLRNWTPGSNGGLDGRLEASAVYAVGATTTGFIAAGTHGGCHTIWTSADGKNWGVYDVPKPAGATDALLQQVAVNGGLVVTAGYAVEKAGDIPLVVVSTDGGRQWRQILLDAPGGVGSVTTLTAAGNGFIAAGEAGPAGAQHAVTWSSPDGQTWSAATPVSAGQITALTGVGGTVSGTAQHGAVPTVVTLTAP